MNNNLESKEEKNKVQSEDKIRNDIDIEQTCIKEYLDIILKEYQIERSKRQSFDSRSGIIISIIAALSIFVFEKIKISSILGLFNAPLTFMILLKIIIGVIVYLSYGISLFYVIKTLNIKKYDNFSVDQVDETLYCRQKLDGLTDLIKIYQKIISQHRKINDKNASYLKLGLYGLLVSFVSIIVFINI